MFDWLRYVGRLLEEYVISVPLYIAAPAMVLIGALDSSLLSLPEINDYLVVGRCYKYPHAAFYFPLFAALGSVLGCLLLYTIMRRGGQALLRKRFKPESSVDKPLPPPMATKFNPLVISEKRWCFILRALPGDN